MSARLAALAPLLGEGTLGARLFELAAVASLALLTGCATPSPAALPALAFLGALALVTRP